MTWSEYKEHEERQHGELLHTDTEFAASTRRRFLKRSSAALIGAVAVPGLLRSSPAEAALRRVSAADAGNTIRMINYAGWIGKGEVAAFKKATGITVQQIIIPQDSARIAKLAADHHAADMLLMDVTTGGRLEQLGVLGRLDLSKIPNYKYVDQTWKVDVFGTKRAGGIVTDWGRDGLAYRTDVVKEDLNSWADFFKLAPKYSGKITIPDFEIDVMSNALLALGLDINTRDPKDVRAAGDLLIKLKPHLKNLATSNLLQSLLDGSGAMAMDWQFDAASVIFKNPNLPLRWVNTTDGMRGVVEGWGVIKGPNVHLVEQFMNFHLAPKWAANFADTTGSAGVETAARRLVRSPNAKSPILNPPLAVLKRMHFSKSLGAAQKYWDQEWTRFKSA